VKAGSDTDIAEDSIIPTLQLHRYKQARSLGDAVEFATIVGDTDDTQGHSANSTYASYTAYDAWNGIHAQAIGASATNGAGGDKFTGDDAVTMVDDLGVYASDQCFWVWPRKQWALSRTMLDNSTNKNLIYVPGGADAPWTTKPLDDFLGFPVVISGQVPTNCTTTGYYDGTTTDRWSVYLVYRRGFVLGDRRAVTVETDKTISTGVVEIVSTWRGDLASTVAASTKVASVTYNIANA
jgi:hypothetical protein